MNLIPVAGQTEADLDEISREMIWYGSDATLTEQVSLRAGMLEAIFEAGDLRYVRVDGIEILRRVYVAIRDHNWGTAANVLSNVRIEKGPDRFKITYDVSNRLGQIDFSWQCTINGSPNGNLRFSMAGQANSSFFRNRIGFCILHPAELAGTTCQVERVDGSMAEGILPNDIDPSQPVMPFTDMRALEYSVRPGLKARLTFEGDVFEMEDQRNWTDASFKTFSTPLRLPYPVEVKTGTQIEQAIELRFSRDQRVSRRTIVKDIPAEASVEVSLDARGEEAPLPGIGFGMASHGNALSENEVKLLQALRPHHLRVTLRLGEAGWEERLRQAAEEADHLGTRLLPALILPRQADRQLGQLKKIIGKLQPEILTWLVFSEQELFRGGTPIEHAVQQARNFLPDQRLGSGTNTDLIFLKRNIPPLDEIDLVSFSINPQVHAFDNLSVVETLQAQSMAVESARRLSNGLPVAVSPLTLKPTWNPYATEAAGTGAPGTLPPQVDRRQLSLFAAGWTIGSLAALARGGAVWATYYETTGWRGVIEQESGSPDPEQFPSRPGMVFPVYLVFRALADCQGGSCLPLLISDPLRLAGLAVRTEESPSLLLANLGNSKLSVELKDIPVQGLDWRVNETFYRERLLNGDTNLERRIGPEREWDGSLEPYEFVGARLG